VEDSRIEYSGERLVGLQNTSDSNEKKEKGEQASNRETTERRNKKKQVKQEVRVKKKQTARRNWG